MCSVPLGLKRIFNYQSYIHVRARMSLISPCSISDVIRVARTSLNISLFLLFLQRVAQSCRQRQPGDARSVQARRAEDLSGVLRRSLGMPLRGRHLWELQGVLQEGRGRSV